MPISSTFDLVIFKDFFLLHARCLRRHVESDAVRHVRRTYSAGARRTRAVRRAQFTQGNTYGWRVDVVTLRRLLAEMFMASSTAPP